MKRISLFASTLLFLSCGSFIRTATGTTLNGVIKQASVEYGCPVENVTLIEKSQRAGNATYVLDVCGSRKVYNQIGSTLQEKK